ncbi:tyrosine-protein phosphatase [Thiomicrorhabdus sp. 6S3-12]|uniref:tyrosine-protein phosphatase n=1 Tax=Thiomicrorhabdus sp. 6S3-12 TaxID=2819681 RepID=UPI001AADF77C|nr:CpsB/CapC family capsule biosynthesis tyrosine phosphatase [Thiomicrorhabdus sp. 6S3-12]MBO1923327.1 hypothetical protein [Thiomicrorhabdus sp. 6S3-12]
MYDLHSHLLPGIDDGAIDLKNALKMAEQAVNCGITHMVCTPHIHIGRFNNDQASISDALQKFRKGLEEKTIPLKVAAAAEIRLAAEIIPLVKQKQLPVLGHWENQEVLLIEFPSDRVPHGAIAMIEWLLDQNYVPMIAHPERNRGFIERPALLDTFLNLGCLTQLTATAITGQFGTKVKETAARFLMEDKITVMASDAHNIRYRPPVFSEAIKYAKTLVGNEGVEKLLYSNPKKISREKFSGL